MQPRFKAIVDDLCRSLGVDPPAGPARLLVSDVEIAIDEDPFGRVLMVTSVIGELAAEPRERQKQIEEIMRRHLGSILECQATVAMDPADRHRIVASAMVAHGLDSGKRLRIAVEDVATLVTRYQSILQPERPRPSAVPETRTGSGFEPALIFRP